VEAATGVHTFLFAVLLIYLPFTRSLHYITRFFGFFLIRWGDRPNLRGSPLEEKIERLLERRVTWQGPHVRQGGSWKEIAKESIQQGQSKGSA
jgi:hypothetical protein